MTDHASPGFTEALNQLRVEFSNFRLQQDDKFAKLSVHDESIQSAVAGLTEGLHTLAATTDTIKSQNKQLIIANESLAASHDELSIKVDSCASDSAKQDVSLKNLMEGFQMTAAKVKSLGSRNQAIENDAEPPSKRQDRSAAPSSSLLALPASLQTSEAFADFTGYSHENFSDMTPTIRANFTILASDCSHTDKLAAIEALHSILSSTPDEFERSNIRAQPFITARAHILSLLNQDGPGAGGA